MAAKPAVPGVLEVALRVADGASIEAGSRFFLSYSGSAPSAADMDSLATAVEGEWSSNIAAQVWSSEYLAEVICTDLSSASGARGQWTGTADGTLSEGTQLPAGVAACFNHVITRRYRGGKPRTFMRMGSTASLQASNEWSADVISGFIPIWHDFIDGIIATTGVGVTLENIVNISYYEGFTVFETPSGRAKNIPTLRAEPVVDTITDTSLAPKLGSQRRRLNL